MYWGPGPTSDPFEEGLRVGLSPAGSSKSPQGFAAVNWDHEPRTGRTVPPTRCCLRLVGRAFLRFLCRQDAGSTLRFMESPLSFFPMHWDHEPTPSPSQEASDSG